MQSWAKSRVLAFIDLVIWSDYSGEALTQHAIGEWLFPAADIDSTEKVRKTVNPLVDEIYMPGFLEWLSHEARRMAVVSAREELRPEDAWNAEAQEYFDRTVESFKRDSKRFDISPED